MEIQKILENGTEYFLPNLSIDLVIIGYKGGVLKCLLLKLGSKWVLPGGYIKKEESVDTAVSRILKERTGLEDPHFKFLSVFGAADRQFEQEFKQYFDNKGLPWREDYWINGRFVTLAHYSLVDIDNTHPVPGEFDEAVDWFPFEELPELWLDHKTIVETARNRLKEDSKNELLTYNLLPKEFTMPQLHRLHQAILQQNLDRSRFQKKMLATGRFERLPKIKKETPGSNPYQYRLKAK
ncbi:NUDIX hydrolase [Allomuricauda sp. SCSIO 65647]|uniref:NUDIX hydrolase n=1 Tax=Allomuricauda sp. SCSIO 65647 TaxID=2908843 RepID=UPI001F2BCEB0|nr:NUDIX domain-containing protein [Muricauda sp. SCSIO 65647]UJH66436.1 NUDIX domain-containing protein [Muricauda sp. SCSIO 65647]